MVKKLPKTDPRYERRSTDRVLDLDALRAFIAGKEQVESFDAFIEVAGKHSAEVIIKMLGKL